MGRQLGALNAMVDTFREACRAEVDQVIERAREAGRAGRLDISSREISSALAHLDRRLLEVDQLKRQYYADVQVAWANINKRGRVLTTFASHGVLGNALRGGMERSRGSQRSRLAQERADVQTAFDVLKLDLKSMKAELRQEQQLIREVRSRRNHPREIDDLR